MAELNALHRFFLTLDDELERIIEDEDRVTQATDSSIPSHEELVAAQERADPEIDELFAHEFAFLDEMAADQYREELSAKFRPHFYAAVTLLTVAVLEAGLTRLARCLHSRRRRSPISPGQVKGSTLDQFLIFAGIMKWPLPAEESMKWAADLYHVRNALIHEAGSIYAVSPQELESKIQKLREIAERQPGLELESVFPEPDLRQLLADLRSRRQPRKRTPAEGVIIRVQREFCQTALARTRSLLQELYAPFLTPPHPKKGRPARRGGRRK
ncbi:MAG: hypothetical protein L0Z53_21595 [Acidobacteriales bacterium]|nr:hypothetical protein [Terriglobales bacterium]